MKKHPILILVVLLALVLSACGPQVTATPAPPPTQPVEPAEPTAPPPPPSATPSPAPTEPQGSGDPTWDRILTGKIVFGMFADYKPYEYYNSDLKIDGYDPAIARELGTRLGCRSS